MLDLSNAVLLAQHNEVVAVDIIQEKVDMINDKISPIADKEIQEFLSKRNLNLVATIIVILHIKTLILLLYLHQQTMMKN